MLHQYQNLQAISERSLVTRPTDIYLFGKRSYHLISRKYLCREIILASSDLLPRPGRYNNLNTLTWRALVKHDAPERI